MYSVAEWSGIDQAYLWRLEKGDRKNPSRDLVLRLALSLVQGSSMLSLHDIDDLLLAADYAPLRNPYRAAAVAPEEKE